MPGNNITPTNNVTAKTLGDYLASKNSPLAGQGANFMKWGLQYNLDPRLMVAVAGAESGFGQNLAGDNNPFGLLYNQADPYHSDYDSWDHAIKGLGRSLTKNDYDLSNTQNMYLGNGSAADKTQAYCASENCQAGLNNIDAFMQEQGADPNALYFPWPDSP